MLGSVLINPRYLMVKHRLFMVKLGMASYITPKWHRTCKANLIIEKLPFQFVSSGQNPAKTLNSKKITWSLMIRDASKLGQELWASHLQDASLTTHMDTTRRVWQSSSVRVSSNGCTWGFGWSPCQEMQQDHHFTIFHPGVPTEQKKLCCTPTVSLKLIGCS